MAGLWIFVEIKEETNEEVGRVLATRCTYCGNKCRACAWCKWPESFEKKMKETLPSLSQLPFLLNYEL